MSPWYFKQNNEFYCKSSGIWANLGAALKGAVIKSTWFSTNPTSVVDSKEDCHWQGTEIESSHDNLLHQLQKSVSYALKYRQTDDISMDRCLYKCQ